MPTPQNDQSRAKSKVADSLQYPIEVFYSQEDKGFIAVAKDLPGCSAFGKTQSDAVAEIQDAIKAWQQAAQAAGNSVPEPSRHVDEVLPSGKILLRIPRSLHASLIECAKKESVSLNQHLVSVLSLSIGATLLREAHAIIASLQTSIRQVGVDVAVRPVTHFRGAVWQFSAGSAVTVVRPLQPLDLRTLPAGMPVAIEGR